MIDVFLKCHAGVGSLLLRRFVLVPYLFPLVGEDFGQSFVDRLSVCFARLGYLIHVHFVSAAFALSRRRGDLTTSSAFCWNKLAFYSFAIGLYSVVMTVFGESFSRSCLQVS